MSKVQTNVMSAKVSIPAWVHAACLAELGFLLSLSSSSFSWPSSCSFSCCPPLPSFVSFAFFLSRRCRFRCVCIRCLTKMNLTTLTLNLPAIRQQLGRNSRSQNGPAVQSHVSKSRVLTNMHHCVCLTFVLQISPEANEPGRKKEGSQCQVLSLGFFCM